MSDSHSPVFSWTFRGSGTEPYTTLERYLYILLTIFLKESGNYFLHIFRHLNLEGKLLHT